MQIMEHPTSMKKSGKNVHLCGMEETEVASDLAHLDPNLVQFRVVDFKNIYIG